MSGIKVVPEVFEVYRTRQGTLENVVLLADYEALQAECERLRKDAERYRWLRNPAQVVGNVIDKMGGSGVYEYRAGDELDDAIDAAMQGDKP